MTPETRKKISDANQHKIIVTPHGTYGSLVAASKTVNKTPEMVRYYCEQGQLQRDGKPIAANGHDYRGWFNLSARPGRQRPVSTPHGDFESISAAARACNSTPASVYQNIRRGRPGWRYQD